MPNLFFHLEAIEQSTIAADVYVLPQGAATSFTAMRDRACP
jgi:hypothetical protein